MHSLVPFLTVSRSRLSIESVKVSPSCVCKGGSNLAMISFPGSELDSWTCFSSGMAFSLEYTLGNCGKLRVTRAGTEDDTGSVVELGDSGVIGSDDSGSSSPRVETYGRSRGSKDSHGLSSIIEIPP